MAQELALDVGGPRDAAFHCYVVPELPALLRVARTLTLNSHDAEDLVQDTILRAYQSITSFDGVYPRAWLFTILRNTHVNRNRRRRPDLCMDADDAQNVADHRRADPAELVERMAFRDAVLAALTTLPEKTRIVVELVDFDSCTYGEEALGLGIPIGTVMSRLHRGRQHIKNQLVAEGFVTKKVGAT